MSSFISLVKSDISIFFNDLAESVNINNVKMDILIDHDRLKDRSKKEYDGIYVGDLLYFAKKDSFIKKPNIGDVQKLNKKVYEVFDIREDLGICEIILKVAGS